jgi:hypothetical protein
LFLGRDNFVLYGLRGSKPYTHVRNFYDPYFVEPNFDLTNVGAKFDFDSVTAETLDEFPYVLTTRAEYASTPPTGYKAVKSTDSYVLWRKQGSPIGREPGETDAAPGRLNGCPPDKPTEVMSFLAAPVESTDWSQSTVESGESATVELDLPPGAWNLSLQYDATRPVTLSSDDGSATLPGNLDYRGTAPYWPAFGMTLKGGQPVTVTATVEDPPLAGQLLGAHSVAHLGSIAATRVGPHTTSCDNYVDWYVP